VFGSNFDTSPGGTQVAMNGINMPIVSVVTEEMLVVRTLVTAAMNGPISVTTSAGSAISADVLTVIPAP
jgi:hypothetical protein